MRRTILLAIAATIFFAQSVHADVSLTTFTLQHAWYPTMEYASFDIGQDRGYFAEEGIQRKE